MQILIFTWWRQLWDQTKHVVCKTTYTTILINSIDIGYDLLVKQWKINRINCFSITNECVHPSLETLPCYYSGCITCNMWQLDILPLLHQESNHFTYDLGLREDNWFQLLSGSVYLIVSTAICTVHYVTWSQVHSKIAFIAGNRLLSTYEAVSKAIRFRYWHFIFLCDVPFNKSLKKILILNSVTKIFTDSPEHVSNFLFLVTDVGSCLGPQRFGHLHFSMFLEAAPSKLLSRNS